MQPVHTPAFIPLGSSSPLLVFKTWFALIYSPPPIKSNFVSIRVSHAGSRLLQQAVHYLIGCVCVCLCAVNVTMRLCLTSWVPLICLFSSANVSEHACACSWRLSIHVKGQRSRWVWMCIRDSPHVQGISSLFAG